MSALVVHRHEFHLSVLPEAVAQRDALLTSTAAVSEIVSELDYADAGNLLAEAKKMVRAIEQGRAEAKAPVLEAGKRIDAAAKDFVAGLEAEIARVGRLVLGYQEAQRRKAEEAARKAREEAARIERERLAAEAEARRKEQEARAEAERKQREAEEADRRAQQTGELSADVAAANAQAEAEAAAEIAKQAAAKAAAAAAAPVIAPSFIVPPPPPKLAGLRQREVWVFDVADAGMLAAQRPDLVTITPKTREITAALERGEQILGIRARKEARL